MEIQYMNFENIALHVPTILLPEQGTDMTKWAVVACDQYTSQPEYWGKVKELTEDSTSTLNLILPEVYLESEGREQMIRNINKNMKVYLEQGVLTAQKPGFILIDRKTSHAQSRKGLVIALDLEQYDYKEGSRTLIRSTEGTILDRLPPRIKVREQAAIELPHIMVLIDDPEKTVIEPLFEKHLERIYNFKLMMQSGHIKGYMVDDENIIRETADNLARLANRETFSKKYSVTDKDVLLYAVGDGNHSFASAKAIWEELKKSAENKKEVMNHPARYALVELVNVHDEGLTFEPIHRVVFNIDAEEMLKQMESFYTQQGSGFSCRRFETLEELQNESKKLQQENTHLVLFITEKNFGVLTVKNPKFNLGAGTLQSFLDDYLKDMKDAKIDYIHGADIVTGLGSKPGNIGFYLPVISKHDLFKTIILEGTLLRKTFSMGKADEKRFYLECRRITV